MARRLALIYSDGSNTVLQEGTTLQQAFAEREMVDSGETDLRLVTRVAWVDFDLLAIVDALSPTPATV